MLDHPSGLPPRPKPRSTPRPMSCRPGASPLALASSRRANAADCRSSGGERREQLIVIVVPT
eukprot:8355050-Pyramimonas_sp.AAC.1